MGRLASESKRSQRKVVAWVRDGGHKDPACGVDGDTMRRADPRIVFFNKDFRPAKKKVEKVARVKSQEKSLTWAGAAGGGGCIKEGGSLRTEMYCGVAAAGPATAAGIQRRETLSPERAQMIWNSKSGAEIEVSDAAGLPNALNHCAKSVWCNVYSDMKEMKRQFRDKEFLRANQTGLEVKRFQPLPRSAAEARLGESQLAETRLGPPRADEIEAIPVSGLDSDRKNRAEATHLGDQGTRQKKVTMETSTGVVPAGVRRDVQPSVRVCANYEQLGSYRERCDLEDAGAAGMNSCRVNRDVATFNAQTIDNVRQRRRVDVPAARMVSDSLVNALDLQRHGDWIYSHDIGRNRPGISTSRKWKARRPAVLPSERLAMKKLEEESSRQEANVLEAARAKLEAAKLRAAYEAGQKIAKHQLAASNPGFS